MAIIHQTIRVTGRVQGVFFRASTSAKAHELGITGLVRNEPDGSVYIEAEGEAEKLGLFTEWCKQGPPGAKVMNCIVQEAAIKGFDSFLISR